MTFTYGDPSTSDKDKIRYLVGDTDADESFVSDEEINYVLDTWLTVEGSFEAVAAVVCENMAAKFAREATHSSDGVSIGLGVLQAQLTEQAKTLRRQHERLLAGGLADAGGITPGERRGPGIKPFDFGTGMHDNIEAGSQAFGDRDADTYLPEEYPGV